MSSSSVRSGICRPDGAGEFGGMGGYKDFAPDGAADTERSRSTELLEERVIHLENLFAPQAKLLGLE